MKAIEISQKNLLEVHKNAKDGRASMRGWNEGTVESGVVGRCKLNAKPVHTAKPLEKITSNVHVLISFQNQ